MTPVRRNQDWLPTLFNGWFDNDDWMMRRANSTAPAINVFETEKEYTLIYRQNDSHQ